MQHYAMEDVTTSDYGEELKRMIADVQNVISASEKDVQTFTFNTEQHLIHAKDDLELKMHQEWYNVENNASFRQRQMVWYYETFGVVGLFYNIGEIAKAEVANSREKNDRVDGSWERLLDGMEKAEKSRTLCYLTSIRPRILKALLNGDLSAEMQRPEFSTRWGSCVKPRPTPGTYVVYMANAGPRPQPSQVVTSSVQTTTTGYGLTLRELARLAAIMRLYIDVDNPESAALAMSIDGDPSKNMVLDYETQRKYGSGTGNDQFWVFEEWLRQIQSVYLDFFDRIKDTKDAHLLDRPLKRCLAYVGLSSKVALRCGQHAADHSSESKMKGLVTAILRNEFGDQFTTSTFAYQVLFTVEDSDVGLDEIITTLICSSYVWDGGLNGTYAGHQRGNPFTKLTQRYEQGLNANRHMLKDSGHCAAHISDVREKFTVFEAALSIAKHGVSSQLSMKADVEEVRKLQLENLARAKAASLMLRHERIKLALDRLRAARRAGNSQDTSDTDPSSRSRGE